MEYEDSLLFTNSDCPAELTRAESTVKNKNKTKTKWGNGSRIYRRLALHPRMVESLPLA